MPYRLKKKGSQVCVVKATTGEEIHCHGTRGQAVQQMLALYASEKKELSKEAIESLAEFYQDESVEELGDLEPLVKAVWTATADLPDSAYLFIEHDGDKTIRHLPVRTKDGKLDAAHLRNAIARANQIKLKDGSLISTAQAEELKNKARKLLASLNKSILDKAIDAVKSLVWEDEPNIDPQFSVYKSADDIWHWQGCYSNTQTDRSRPSDRSPRRPMKPLPTWSRKVLSPRPIYSRGTSTVSPRPLPRRSGLTRIKAKRGPLALSAKVSSCKRNGYPSRLISRCRIGCPLRCSTVSLPTCRYQVLLKLTSPAN